MPGTTYFVWGADWMPLMAHLNVDVIDAVNRAIAEGMRVDPGRGLEIGGILLGNVENIPGSPLTVRIERFDPVDSEHRRGSSYDLTDRDKRVLGRKLAWWNKHGHKENLRPVGFFRSHTRRGLYLDNDDFQMLQNYFPERYSVFLLVRPVPGAASLGGFFFWQDGEIRREASFQEFPFNASRLPLVGTVKPLVVAPSVVGRPASIPRPNPLPTWLRLAIPIAVGMFLGVVVFKVTTAGIAPVPPARQTLQLAKPVPASPVASLEQPQAANSSPVVKPSPLQPKSRPMIAPAPTPETPAAHEVAVNAPAPAGNASRAEPGPAEFAPETREPSPSPAPPAAAFAPITTPARAEHPQRAAAVATVTVEPVTGSKLGRIVGHIPGFRRKKNHDFVPARAIRQIAPSVPADERLARDVPVDLRITVDPAGSVADVQASRGADKQLVRLAEDAARSWQFVPAKRNDETVSSELILHFMFPGTKAEP